MEGEDLLFFTPDKLMPSIVRDNVSHQELTIAGVVSSNNFSSLEEVCWDIEYEGDDENNDIIDDICTPPLPNCTQAAVNVVAVEQSPSPNHSCCTTKIGDVSIFLSNPNRLVGDLEFVAVIPGGSSLALCNVLAECYALIKQSDIFCGNTDCGIQETDVFGTVRVLRK